MTPPRKKEDMFYGLLTVKLQNPPADPADQYKEIKRVLGLSDPLIDDDLGVVPNTVPHMEDKLAPGEKMFIVGMESKTLWAMADSGHPNVVGCMHALGYRGGHPPLGLKDTPRPPRRPSPGPKP